MDGFTALADPTRRKIVELLAAGPMDAGSLASEFAVSRPAISRHLRVLRETGMVKARIDAQRRIYHIEASGLAEVANWVRKYESFWTDRLDDLERAAKERR